jgi:uncharacterized protein (TIGR02996 family)
MTEQDQATQANFEAAIAADPLGKEARLIYADWLEDHDLPELAALHRRAGTPEWDEACAFLLRVRAEITEQLGTSDSVVEILEFLERIRDGRATGLPFETSELREWIDQGLWRYYDHVTGTTTSADQIEDMSYMRCAC